MSFWFRPYLVGPHRPIIFAPEDEVTIATPPYISWHTSPDMSVLEGITLPFHFHLQIAHDHNFNNVFVDLHSRELKSSGFGDGTFGEGTFGGHFTSGPTGFEFENPASVWNPIPPITGMPFAYVGSDVRYLADVQEGDYSVRVRVEQMI